MIKNAFRSLYQSPKQVLGAQSPLMIEQKKVGGLRDSQNLPPGTAHGGKPPLPAAHNVSNSMRDPHTLAQKKLHRHAKEEEPKAPFSTFGVSREHREQVMSHKYFSPPAGAYNVKFTVTDPANKIARLIPKGSSPEKEPPRLDYNRTNTLLWLPQQREIERT